MCSDEGAESYLLSSSLSSSMARRFLDEEVDEEVEATDELEADTVVESDCFESLALGSHSGLGL